jgi:UDP-N-acetylmuramate--alanine ligase
MVLNSTLKSNIFYLRTGMPKLRVGVLMGGKSIEREVSFNSGRTVCDHLDTSRYTIVPLYQTQEGHVYILPWHFLHRGKTTDFEHRLAREATLISWDDLKQLIDFVYVAVHGRYAEDGTVQGFLEVLRIPYLGSKVFGSALGMDKIIQKEFLISAGIPVAPGIAVYPDQVNDFDAHKQSIFSQLVEKNIDFPCIVKPHKEGSSLGISVVFQANDLHEALHKACYAYPEKPQAVLIEKRIEGMEFSCIVLTHYKTGELMPLPPTEIVPEQESHFYDYEQKYMPGRATKFTPARVSNAMISTIQETCMAAMRALNITNIGRFDGFVTSDSQVIITDPNTLSGMGPASFLFREAAELNMSHTDVINHLIETELHYYGMLDAILERERKELAAMNTPKIRVAVLMGGASNEREISLESGRNVCYKLSPHKYSITPIFVNQSMELYTLNQSQLVRNCTKEISQCVDESQKISWGQLPHLVDFVFIALHGGEGENGSVQGTLEMLGIPYNGSSVLASALCMDKFKTTQFLHSKGFDVPQAMLISAHEWRADREACKATIMQKIGLPIIVKPHDDGCSVMVQKVKRESDIINAIEILFASGKEHALVEECIVGMELTVGVIGNDTPRALPPSQAVCAADILSIEEKFLPGAGENQTPAPLPQHTLTFVQRIVESTYKALGCKGYSRIDCFYQTAEQSRTGKERVVIIENNSLPGLTPATCIFHQAAELGIKPMDFIDTIVQLGIEEHSKHTQKDIPPRVSV